ncbi:HD domain-containing protein [Chryseobacterium oryctis]|uniref:Metal-dependent HD superfamily phosphohydrolase n=1 Tax=Chryseobacterium oryctis TaxID=2952618 RepID=A0ABT3HN95_9FLAO|nr:hypothetical protein [Chryseobacterium oryctis]MCW3161267.1 hypothetical protein [Chryseobacterium oryctis]
MNLKERFFQNCNPFTQDKNLVESLWLEIEAKYSEKGRHYHNLQHLENMSLELENVKSNIVNSTNISFSIFYHDIIYNVSSKSNEEKSADFATERLQKLNVNPSDIENVYYQILATKAHQKSEDNDVNYLLDADLSVLGQDKAIYYDYTQKIRKEYSIYPDILYKPGRKKVLKHFLELESIFKTDYFKEKYEKQAKENLRFELKIL